jgi:hypothetical protein
MKLAGRLAALAAVLVCACAQAPGRPGSAEHACDALYARTDRAVERAGVGDGQAARVEGFPTLRVDRLLASYAAEPLTEAQFDAWVRRLRALDRDARRVEAANLPAAERERLHAEHAALVREHGGLEAALEACGERLTARDLRAAEGRAALRKRAVVPDDYDTWKRIVGLYWVTRIPFASGVRRYQREVEAVFTTPLGDLPLDGRLVAYLPPRSADSPPAPLPRDALGIPIPDAPTLDRLFHAHAPVWLVDTRDDDDRIGALAPGADAALHVDLAAPVVYRRVAYTRYQDQVLLQLVYSVWFPARPKASRSDLLGGHLDGVVWRVTLAPDGTPVLYDSIHSCGCYQQFFPTPRAQRLPQPDTLDETAFVPQQLGAPVRGQRIALRIASGTHYLQRVLAVEQTPPGATLPFRDEDTLRSLAAPDGGRRSAFRPDGIVPGSERGERYVFWPMGVREPGAMRQWGRHATAFVGRRHFDEARLMQRYFLLRLQ